MMMPIKDSYLILKPGMEIKVIHRSEINIDDTGMFLGVQIINGNVSGIVLKSEEILKYYPFNKFTIELI